MFGNLKVCNFNEPSLKTLTTLVTGERSL